VAPRENAKHHAWPVLWKRLRCINLTFTLEPSAVSDFWFAQSAHVNSIDVHRDGHIVVSVRKEDVLVRLKLGWTATDLHSSPLWEQNQMALVASPEIVSYESYKDLEASRDRYKKQATIAQSALATLAQVADEEGDIFALCNNHT